VEARAAGIVGWGAFGGGSIVRDRFECHALWIRSKRPAMNDDREVDGSLDPGPRLATQQTVMIYSA